jgi:phenylacetate-CoA ligase
VRMDYHRRRLADFAAAARLTGELAARERWPRERLAAHQQERLERLVRHAQRHSPFWAERLAGVHAGGRVALARLPILRKAEMMERFDELVCDPRLGRDELLAGLERAERDEILLGRYRVMATSGSSGSKGLFVYDRAGWRAIMAVFLRFSAAMGVRPRVPRRRMAVVSGAAPTHMSRQGAAGMAVGAHRILALAVTAPVERLVEELNAFRPDFLHAYPSLAIVLADEQLAGRLRLSLAAMSTSSELCTPATADRLAEAFGVRPFNLYATTEGLFGWDCERHDGLHLREDLALVENVDVDGRKVPPGALGGRLLVTNLENLAQPIIRLEVPDAVILDPDPCPCGRVLRRLAAVEGRDDEVLALGAGDGATVVVHPAHFAVVTRDREVREFQVRQEGRGVRILVVPAQGAGAALESRLANAVTRRLAELGVAAPRVAVERRASLPRSAGGKLQIVVAERAAESVGVR